MKKLYFGIFFIPLAVNPFALNIYAGAKTAWFLLFMGLGILYAFWQNDLKLLHHRKTLIYLLLWFLSLFLSTIFSEAPVQSVFGDFLFAKGLIFYALLFIHFILCWQIFSDQKNQKLFFNLLKLLAAFLAMYGIVQQFNPANAEYLFRAYGTMGQPNFLGQFLIFPFFIVLGDLFEGFKKKLNGEFWLNAGLFLLIVVVIYLTKNRATWIAIAASFYLWFLFFCPVKKTGKLITTILLGVFTSVFTFAIGVNLRSLNIRWLLWGAALQLLDVKSFFVGIGPNAFYREIVTVLPENIFKLEMFYKLPASPHNEILEALLERGVLGLLIYLVPIVFLFYLLFKKKLKTHTGKAITFGLLAYYVSAQFSFSTIEHFVFLAALWAILLLELYAFKAATFSMKNIFASVALFVFSLVLFFGSFSFIKTDVLLANGIKQYVRGEPYAYKTFERATESMPMFSYPKKLLIDLFVDKNPGEVQKHLDAYGRITSQDYNYNILSLKLAASLGDFNAAEENIKIGLENTPNLPLLHTEAGNFYFEKGDCVKAMEYYNILKSMAPEFEDGSEEERIFEKHATPYVEAMGNMRSCEKL